MIKEHSAFCTTSDDTAISTTRKLRHPRTQAKPYLLTEETTDYCKFSPGDHGFGTLTFVLTQCHCAWSVSTFVGISQALGLVLSKKASKLGRFSKDYICLCQRATVACDDGLGRGAGFGSWSTEPSTFLYIWYLRAWLDIVVFQTR